MTVPTSLPKPPHSRWIRVRKVGAAVAAATFFGTIAASPLAMSSAYAVSSPSEAFFSAPTQQFTSEAGFDPKIHLSASAAEDLAAGGAPVGALYTLEDFLFRGVVNWGGYKFTFYSQQVLPGGGLVVPGRHVNPAGYVSDADGYIVLAGSAPKGTVYETPFGYKGKIYDRGTVGTHLDVYIR